MRIAGRIVPTCRARAAVRGPCGRSAWSCPSSTPARTGCGSRRLRAGRGRAGRGRRRSATAWAASTPPPRVAPTSPPVSRPTPSSTTSGSSPICSPPPWRIRRWRRTVAAARAAHGHDQAGPGPWRRQPEEHPARPRRPGVPRRRVRLVRRSRVRPRLLPQSPAAEMPVDARCRAGLPRLLRRARGRAISQTSSWEPRGRARGAGGGLAARPVPGPHRRQVAGRVCDRAGRQGAGAQDRQHVPAGARRTAWHAVRDAWAVELGL